jgi:D-xylose transport system substrate-binding protein
MSTVIADEFWTVADLCTPEYKAACDKAGIK